MITKTTHCTASTTYSITTYSTATPRGPQSFAVVRPEGFDGRVVYSSSMFTNFGAARRAAIDWIDSQG